MSKIDLYAFILLLMVVFEVFWYLDSIADLLK
jgi:hypothetical protein